MALDEPKDNDDIFEIDGFTYLIDKHLLASAQPVLVDFSPSAFVLPGVSPAEKAHAVDETKASFSPRQTAGTVNKKERRKIMRTRNCCKTMEMELAGWKASVYDIARKMEQLPGGEKEKVHQNIQDLHILIADMDDRIEQIRNTCAPETGMDDIRAEREAFNAAASTLQVTTEDAMQGLGAGNFGG
jgi:hypothetical protein